MNIFDILNNLRAHGISPSSIPKNITSNMLSMTNHQIVNEISKLKAKLSSENYSKASSLYKKVIKPINIAFIKSLYTMQNYVSNNNYDPLLDFDYLYDQYDKNTIKNPAIYKLLKDNLLQRNLFKYIIIIHFSNKSENKISNKLFILLKEIIRKIKLKKGMLGSGDIKEISSGDIKEISSGDMKEISSGDIKEISSYIMRGGLTKEEINGTTAAIIAATTLMKMDDTDRNSFLSLFEELELDDINKKKIINLIKKVLKTKSDERDKFEKTIEIIEEATKIKLDEHSRISKDDYRKLLNEKETERRGREEAESRLRDSEKRELPAAAKISETPGVTVNPSVAESLSAVSSSLGAPTKPAAAVSPSTASTVSSLGAHVIPAAAVSPSAETKISELTKAPPPLSIAQGAPPPPPPPPPPGAMGGPPPPPPPPGAGPPGSAPSGPRAVEPAPPRGDPRYPEYIERIQDDKRAQDALTAETKEKDEETKELTKYNSYVDTEEGIKNKIEFNLNKPKDYTDIIEGWIKRNEYYREYDIKKKEYVPLGDLKSFYDATIKRIQELQRAIIVLQTESNTKRKTKQKSIEQKKEIVKQTREHFENIKELYRSANLRHKKYLEDIFMEKRCKDRKNEYKPTQIKTKEKKEESKYSDKSENLTPEQKIIQNIKILGDSRLSDKIYDIKDKDIKKKISYLEQILQKENIEEQYRNEISSLLRELKDYHEEIKKKLLNIEYTDEKKKKEEVSNNVLDMYKIISDEIEADIVNVVEKALNQKGSSLFYYQKYMKYKSKYLQIK